MLRRRFLSAGGAAMAGGLFTKAAGADFSAPYLPARIEPERVKKSVVGLRPYRREGFALRAERFGDKTIVHNYGHGGCGVTLAFGCAELALRAAGDSLAREAAVIGAGAIGLATARALVRKGVCVTVYAAEFPPHTTSNIAAALWEPATLFDAAAVDQRFLDQFRFAARRSFEETARLAPDPRYGVSWIRRLALGDRAPAELPGADGEGADLYPEYGVEEDSLRRFGFAHVARWRALMIDADRFLAALIDDLRTAGAGLVARRFSSPNDVAALDAPLIFNCTGYGARTLFGDRALTPISGQLAILEGQSGIDYGYVTQSAEGMLYLFPRRDSLVLGGTHGRGDASLEPRPEETLRMLAGHARIAAQFAAGR